MGSRSKYRARLSSYKAALDTSPAEIKCEASEEGAQGPAKFSGIAYSGGTVPGYTATPRLAYPFIINLSGTKKARNVKANLDHKGSQRVGHVSAVENDGKQLTVEGALSAATSHRDEVLNSHMSGYEWEFSAEFDMAGKRFVKAGERVTVNGQSFQGPIFVFDKSTFTDVAFVDHGADHGNAARVAASNAGDKKMNEFEQFVAKCGLDHETIGDEQRATLQAAFDAQAKLAKNGSTQPTVKTFEEGVAEARANLVRQQTITRMANEALREHPLYIDQIAAMAKMAMESDTDPDKFELELLRATRARAGSFSVSRTLDSDPEVIECALAMAAGLPKIEDHYSEQTLNMVDRARMRNFTLQGLLLQVASANGYVCRAGERIHNGNIREVLEYCFPPVHARLSGFSTVSLPGILGNIANKEILAGYMEEDTTWQEVATVKSVSNFHAHTSYRMLDDLEYEEVGPNGEIKHGVLQEESYTRQAKTYAKMLGLNRQQIINDDLGAFDDIRDRLGRGAGKKFNNVFWARFMDNAAFFTSARGNYISGATTNLGSDGVGLELGVIAFRGMKSPTEDGEKRVGASMGSPRILLVPPQLEVMARRFFASLNLVGGGNATAVVPEANVFAGLYRPVVQDRLSDAAFTGNSTKAWYLFGESLKPMVVSFLNGQRTPIVESADADFHQLGIQFRGYHDFGADQSEYLSGVKSKGEA